MAFSAPGGLAPFSYFLFFLVIAGWCAIPAVRGDDTRQMAPADPLQSCAPACDRSGKILAVRFSRQRGAVAKAKNEAVAALRRKCQARIYMRHT